MGRGVFSPVMLRPLFDHLRLVTCRTFETPAANTIPLFCQEPSFVAEVYGDEAVRAGPAAASGRRRRSWTCCAGRSTTRRRPRHPAPPGASGTPTQAQLRELIDIVRELSVHTEASEIEGGSRRRRGRGETRMQMLYGVNQADQCRGLRPRAGTRAHPAACCARSTRGWSGCSCSTRGRPTR